MYDDIERKNEGGRRGRKYKEWYVQGGWVSTSTYLKAFQRLLDDFIETEKRVRFVAQQLSAGVLVSATVEW